MTLILAELEAGASRCAVHQGGLVETDLYKHCLHLLLSLMRNTRGFNMNMRTRHQGFSLLEMMISMSLGLIVMGSMVQLFKMGTTTSRLVVQRTEMQQNMRAAIELMTKDIESGGTGLPDAGIQLPIGGTVSRYGCDQSTCHVPGGTYPSNGAVANYMTGILPGYSNGVEAKAVIPAAPGTRSDSITVIYADYSFPLNQYWLDFPTLASTGTLLNVNVPFPAPESSTTADYGCGRDPGGGRHLVKQQPGQCGRRGYRGQ